MGSQWQGVMRGNDVLHPTDEKGRTWNPIRDTHIGRLTWEKVDPSTHNGCSTRIRWRMKQSKTDPAAEQAFQKSISQRSKLIRYDRELLGRKGQPVKFQQLGKTVSVGLRISNYTRI